MPTLRQRIAALVLPIAATLLLAACGGAPSAGTAPNGISTQAVVGIHRHSLPEPRIVAAGAPLQCVPYARQITGVAIRGDAWTWWAAAGGHYARGNVPVPGSVLVLKRSQRLRLGHVAVVTAVINAREILVDQANWLNRGRIHLSTPVRDVSAANDWSAVKVWYTPSNIYGVRTYHAYGFIYPAPA